jgi:NADH-quinone oxidoreductase subunit N
VVFSLIGAFYYLRIVKVMYFDEPTSSDATTASADLKLILSVNGLAVLGLGLMPNALMAVCLSATVPYGP